MDYKTLIAHVSEKQERLEQYHWTYPCASRARTTAAKSLRIAKESLETADRCERMMIDYERAT
jgi:hypothetical protein